MIHLRTWTKLSILIVIATIAMIAAVFTIYKPIYGVTLDGELIGYSEDKSKLQERINDYIEKGNEQNVAFVDIEDLPEYHLCFLKKDIEPNDDEIFEKVTSQGQNYYKFYSINVDSEEKLYVASFDEAEEVVNELKDKDSNNKDDLSIVEKYENKLEDFSSIEDAVDELYEKKIVQSSVVVGATGMNTSGHKVELGISLIHPVSGIVTSRFGGRAGSSIVSSNHKGTDIGASYGAPIKAVAGGTVTVAEYGYNGGYGNYVIISHGNGIETVYAHCSSLSVSAGQSVSQGQQIAAVGSTGNSTGDHLHLEIRVNGVAQDPQNYLY